MVARMKPRGDGAIRNPRLDPQSGVTRGAVRPVPAARAAARLCREGVAGCVEPRSGGPRGAGAGAAGRVAGARPVTQGAFAQHPPQRRTTARGHRSDPPLQGATPAPPRGQAQPSATLARHRSTREPPPRALGVDSTPTEDGHFDPSRYSLAFSRKPAPFLTSHSQSTSTSHPDSRRRPQFSASRATFPSNFGIQ